MALDLLSGDLNIFLSLRECLLRRKNSKVFLSTVRSADRIVRRFEFGSPCLVVDMPLV